MAFRTQPEHVRLVFNDTAAGQLWLVFGEPAEPADTLEMTERSRPASTRTGTAARPKPDRAPAESDRSASGADQEEMR